MNDFNLNLGVAKTDNFSAIYPEINSVLLGDEYPWKESRDGKVKEILDFKTQLTNPYRRLVGGRERDINIFFLFAEAMWIWSGRKDVKFLTIFNKKMADFSDDGEVFHAPYGFRLRHWGVRSEDKFLEENMHAAQGYDQVADAIRILANNPNSRQVVMSIWNPDFDLGTKTKDIPCNDLVMLKIREGKLITTIANRSNDLHWGLPTNIFQFGFLTELISGVLGIELGTQTHNSQSLHLYEWNPISQKMENSEKKINLYEYGVERKIDFNFTNVIALNRLRELDIVINKILGNVWEYYRTGDVNHYDEKIIKDFSKYLYEVYIYLLCYIKYKKAIQDKTASEREKKAKDAMDFLKDFSDGETYAKWDVNIMALNFFAKRCGVTNEYIGWL